MPKSWAFLLDEADGGAGEGILLCALDQAFYVGLWPLDACDGFLFFLEAV